MALTGDVMTMPGLPKRPAALNMDVAADGTQRWFVLISIIKALTSLQIEDKVLRARSF